VAAEGIPAKLKFFTGKEADPETKMSPTEAGLKL